MTNFRQISADAVNSDIQGTSLEIEGIGDITMTKKIDGKETKFTLLDVGHAPNILTNLVSLGKMQECGITLTFPSNSKRMFAKYKGKLIMLGLRSESTICKIINVKTEIKSDSNYVLFNAGEDYENC